jgi:hypothetical protein
MPRLTTRVVNQLSADGDVFVWDTQVPGFGVRCRAGQKAYVLQYRVLTYTADFSRRLPVVDTRSCFSDHCPGGFELGFRIIIPTLGDFTATSQRPIPPGLTRSPQA